MEQNQNSDKDEIAAEEYKAPAIESVVTPDELEREVHYAGGITPVP